MDRQSKIKLWMISFAGGVAWGILFFVFFGLAAGYSWFLAGLCAIGGLAFGLLFGLSLQCYFWISQRTEKVAQRKMEKWERDFEELYTHKFSGFMPYGEGAKRSVCQTNLYFSEDKVWVVFYYSKRVCTAEIPNSDIRTFYCTQGYIGCQCYQYVAFFMFLKNEEDVSKLVELLTQKGFYTTLPETLQNRIFLSYEEAVGSNFIEFQYCLEEPPQQREWYRRDFKKQDSLFVHVDVTDIQPYYELLASIRGRKMFYAGAMNYFDREETKELIAQIKAAQPKEGEVLIAWLEKAVSMYNGFYFLGV